MTNQTTTAEHTLGPWGVVDDGSLGPIVVRAQSLKPIATVWPIEALQSDKGHPVSEKLANADLIAAAPDLLAALETLGQRHDWIDAGLAGQRERFYGPCFCHFGQEGDEGHEPACLAARAAIAKTRGAS